MTLNAPHYVLPISESSVRPMRPRVSAATILDRRAHEWYSLGFLALAVSPISFVGRCAQEKRFADAGKASAYSLLRAWAIHFTHAGIAAAVVGGARTSWTISVADEYDASDRRFFLHFSRLFKLLHIPRGVAFLVGNEPVDDDELFFDANYNFYGRSISPVAAAEDSFKRNWIYDVSYMLVETGATFAAEKLELDNEVYGIATREDLPKRLASRAAGLVAGEIGAAVGRAAAPDTGNAEFALEFVCRIFLGPQIAKLINVWPFGAETKLLTPAQREKAAKDAKDKAAGGSATEAASQKQKDAKEAATN